jgi:Short C-terminal domain
VSVAEQLSQLDDLRRRGVISRREFAAKKSELLSRM